MTLKLGIVPSTGSKENIWSWIHITDLVHIYADLVEGKISPGVYNGVAPHPTTQGELIDEIFHNATFPKYRLSPVRISPNIPAWFLKLIMGERSQIALSSQQILTKQLIDNGFTFKYEKIGDAIYNLIHED